MGSRLGVLVTLLLAGCTETQSATVPITGPDGSPMMHVSCGSDEARCYEMAGRSCPYGYDIARTAGGSDGNFLVRCRAPVAYAAPAYTPPAYAPPAYTPPAYVPPEYAPAPSPTPVSSAAPPAAVEPVPATSTGSTAVRTDDRPDFGY